MSGILVYIKTDEQNQSDGSWLMNESRISVKTLDLNREFPDNAEQLNRIAEDPTFWESGGSQ